MEKIKAQLISLFGDYESKWAAGVVDDYMNNPRHNKYKFSPELVQKLLSFLQWYVDEEKSCRALFNRCEKSLGGNIDKKIAEEYSSKTGDTLDFSKCYFLLDLAEAL